MNSEKTLAVNPRLSTDTGFLKIIALATLLVDHIGYLYCSNEALMRAIGRVSFPLFAYCLVLGTLYTKNFGKFCLRLLIFALVSEPFYLYAFYGWTFDRLRFVFMGSENFFTTFCENIDLNIGFTLLLGLISIYGLRFKKYYLSVSALAAAAILPVEYGIFGVGLVLIMYILLKAPLYIFIPMLGAYLWLAPFCPTSSFNLFGLTFATQSLGVFALLFMLFKTNTGIRLPRWLNYGFYPAHLAIFCVINLLLN